MNDLQPTRILVTGGAGFIGSHVVDALVAAGHKVAIVDNLSTGKKENLNDQAKFFEVDICDKEKLAEVFGEFKPEAIFHLAAQASVNDSIKNPQKDVLVNVIGTINLLELAKENNCQKFIFSSTGGAIYGNEAPRPTKETADQKPLTPYGMDKLAAEKYIEFFAENYQIKPVILRYANVYGPRQNPHGEAGVVAIFTERILENREYNLYGDGTQTRDFVFVKDVVQANLKAFEKDITGKFNIGTEKEITINEIVDLLKKHTGSNLDPRQEKARVEQRHSCLDASLAKGILGWSAKTTIDEGIQKTVEWYGNNDQ